MRHTIPFLAIAGVVVSAHRAGAQIAVKCTPADSQSTALITYIKSLETTTDPELVNARNNIYHLPVVATNKITQATDEKTCGKASTAYGPPAGSTTPPTVYVIQLENSGYAVLDPDQAVGEYTTVLIFDRQFRKIGGWTGP